MINMQTNQKKGWLDRKVGKFASRKFLVWITGTIALFHGFIVSGDWVAISLGFIGVEGFAKIASMWKHGKTFVEKAPHEARMMFEEEVTDPNDPERMNNTL